MAEGESYISVTHLNLPIPQKNEQVNATSLGIKPSANEELSRIREALNITNGNKSRAAQLLGIDRKTLYNKLKQYGEDL